MPGATATHGVAPACGPSAAITAVPFERRTVSCARRDSGGCVDVADNHVLVYSKQLMTVQEHQNLPQGYVQLTEGRIRTTDLVCAEASSTWREPHAFVVGSAVGEDGTRVARRMPAEPRSNRSRS